MLCVTIIDLIVRKTSRPISTGRHTLTNASSPTNARSPIARVAHGSRWPPPPIRTERPPQIPDPRKARRQRSSRSAPNCDSSPIANGLLAHDGRPWPERHAVGDHDARRDDQRVRLRDRRLPRCTAPASRSAATLSVGDSARNDSWSSDSRNDGIERAGGLVEIEGLRQRDAVRGNARERRSGRGRGASLLRDDQLLDVLLRDEAALLDRREVDPVQLGELDRLPRRLPVARRRLRRRLLLGLRVDRRELVRGLRDVGDRLAQLDLDVVAVELHDRPRAGRLHLDRRLRRLDDADGLARGDLRAILDEPLREERVLGVRVFARENDLEHAGASFARRRAPTRRQRRPRRSGACRPRAGERRG